MSKKDNLYKAKYSEYQASLWGAMGIAFGLGVLMAGFFQSVGMILILVSIPLHAWGMIKIHKRNK